MKSQMKKFIITDPSYIISDKEYKKIVDDHYDYSSDFDMEVDIRYGEKPRTYHDKNGEKIKIFILQNTPNGDGSFTFRGQRIGVDAGLLCVAYRESGWEKEKLGARFSDIRTAKSNFDNIINKF